MGANFEFSEIPEMSDYNVDTSGRFPIKAWTKGVQQDKPLLIGM